MPTYIKDCSDCNALCTYENGFYGFLSNPQCPTYYKYLAIFDWDWCLLDCETAISDFFSGGELSLTSPSWPTNEANCDPPVTGVVDGHRVYEDNGDETATCIEATGYYASYLGSIENACILRDSLSPYIGIAQSDQFATSCGPTLPSGCCPDVTEDVPLAYMWNDE